MDLCAEHNILVPSMKVVGVEEVNAVYESLERGNATGERFVIDIGTLNEAAFATCDKPPPNFEGGASSITFGALVGNICSMLCEGWC